MRNISVRIILAVLLVASIGCAGVMNCKTEWFPQVKSLARQVQWTSGRVADIRRHPKRYLCATFYTVEGTQVYAAVEKEPNGDLVIVINKENGWDYMHLTYVEPINEFGIVTVDAYGIKNATTLPSKYYADAREKLRNSISDDADCPDSWKTNGVCDPVWYSIGRN